MPRRPKRGCVRPQNLPSGLEKMGALFPVFALENRKPKVTKFILSPSCRSLDSNEPVSFTAHALMAQQSPDLALTADKDLEADDDESVPRMTICERLCADDNRHKATLFAMVLGLTCADNRKLGDTEVSPFEEMKHRKLLVPASANCHKEALRRGALESTQAPQCKHWNCDKVIIWLKENPIKDLCNVQWLILGEKKVHNLVNKAKEEKAAASSSMWTNNLPWIHFSTVHGSKVSSPDVPLFLLLQD